MIDENEDSFTVPSDPAVRQAIKDLVQEAANAMIQMDSFRELLKEIIARAADEYEVPKRTFRRMAKAYHKQNYKEVSQDDEVFQTFYETIVENKSP